MGIKTSSLIIGLVFIAGCGVKFKDCPEPNEDAKPVLIEGADSQPTEKKPFQFKMFKWCF